MNQENKTITKEELFEMLKNHELSDDELDGVAGGINIDYENIDIENMTPEEQAKLQDDIFKQMTEGVDTKTMTYSQCQDFLGNRFGYGDGFLPWALCNYLYHPPVN